MSNKGFIVISTGFAKVETDPKNAAESMADTYPKLVDLYFNNKMTHPQLLSSLENITSLTKLQIVPRKSRYKMVGKYQKI